MKKTENLIDSVAKCFLNDYMDSYGNSHIRDCHNTFYLNSRMKWLRTKYDRCYMMADNINIALIDKVFESLIGLSVYCGKQLFLNEKTATKNGIYKEKKTSKNSIKFGTAPAYNTKFSVHNPKSKPIFIGNRAKSVLNNRIPPNVYVMLPGHPEENGILCLSDTNFSLMIDEVPNVVFIGKSKLSFAKYVKRCLSHTNQLNKL